MENLSLGAEYLVDDEEAAMNGGRVMMPTCTYSDGIVWCVGG